MVPAGLGNSARATSVPLAICPANPRKSRFGRFTHWIGSRRLWRCSRDSSSSQVSRNCISVGPRYQGMAALGAVMLSPPSADSGIEVMSVKPMRDANPR